MNDRSLLSLSWLPRLLILATIASAILLVYHGTSDAPFVFDDLIQIDGVDHSVPWTFDRWLGRRSLPHFTFDLNVWTGGLNVTWFHAVNIGLHILVSWLVFFLVYELLPLSHRSVSFNRWGFAMSSRELWASAAALLFAVHPVQTQAVTYIVQRITVMAALWYLASLVTYIRYRKTGRLSWATASLGAAVLAMHSKEISFTLPLAIALIEVMFFAQTWSGNFRRRGLALIPWLLLLIIIPANILGVTQALLSGADSAPATVTLEKIDEGTRQPDAPSRRAYLITQLSVIPRYLQLVVWPMRQNIDHDWPLATKLATWTNLSSALLIAAILAAAAWLWRRHQRAAAFGLGFFFLALLPESSFFPLTDLMVEHRLYLPLAGLTLSFAALGHHYGAVLARWRLADRVSGNLIIFVGVLAIVVALSAAAQARNLLWRDPIALWTDSVAKSPGKARAHNNLGHSLTKVGRLTESIEAYQRAIALDPTYVRALVNLGTVYGELGQPQESITYLLQALAVEPKNPGAYHNLGIAYEEVGQVPAAIDAYEHALRLNPQFVDARLNLALIYSKQGRNDLALEQYQEALQNTPNEPDIYNNMGVVYFRQGDTTRAHDSFREALRLDPAHAAAQQNLQKIQRPAGGGLEILR